VGCYVWYSDEGTGRGPSPPRPLIAVPNVTAHPSTASVPITVLLYNDPLLCRYNVPIKALNDAQWAYTYRYCIMYSLVEQSWADICCIKQSIDDVMTLRLVSNL